jgi:hypothetical protein
MLIMTSTATVTENILRTDLLNMISLRENERIVRILRRHSFGLLGAGLLPVLAFLTAGALRTFYQFNFFGYAWQVFAGLAVVSALYVSGKYLIWKRNAFILTDQRVVQHVQKGLLSAQVREVEYGNIADMVVRKRGLSALFGDRGTLVLTTDTGQRIVAEDIASPGKIIELINQLRRRSAIPVPHVSVA